MNNKQSSVVQTAIKQIYQRILDSKNPNTLTKRGGDYRIGLQAAINILENLKPMHKEEIIDSFGVGCQVEASRLIGYHEMAEQYYNETFNTEEK